MSLTDELDALANAHHCATCEWRASRIPDEQAHIDAKIREIRDAQNRYGRYADLYNVCTRHGLQSDIEAFRHHCRTHVSR